jgi:transposase
MPSIDPLPDAILASAEKADLVDREGHTNREIAARFGCARKTVSRYRRRAGLPPAPSGTRQHPQAGDGGARP